MTINCIDISEPERVFMRVLVFAPHNDDEVLGVGGTIAKYAESGHDVYVCEVTSGSDINLVNRIKNEALEAHHILGVKETFFMELPVVGLKETATVTINGRFREVIRLVRPEIVFLPHKGDIHIDHQETTKAAMVALRPMENPQLKEIYSYETLSETEWNVPSAENAFIPNVYSDVSDQLRKKLDAMSCYRAQLYEFPHPRSLGAIEALARFRGSTVGCRGAEAFMLVRKVIGGL